ncbi:universal stress protein [Vogesella sp. LIG4]|uniref:universal stress protein n=1 Tax=Vogesella sp. LIG4 TaxID=1192162 RepID=UPI00081FDED9|nr:universal stress protein [Vogesella sp. LIG4]SCK19231.1 Nucleotide-binding universal stress protein, UspA family [Vogesella sp. LIG4]
MTLCILLAVDGSEGSLHAVRRLLRLRERLGGLELHLLTVLAPAESGHVRWFVDHAQLEDYYRDKGLAALQQARALLDAAGQGYTPHIAVGLAAATIAHYAGQVAADLVLMGSHGHGGIGRALLGSVTAEVIALSPVPVTVVSHD